MTQLKYYIHIILNSRYKIIWSLFIYILIYILLKNPHTTYCMTENPSVPEVAEAKSTSTEMPNLIKDIQAFAGSRASALESVIQEKDSIISEKDQFITKQEKYISMLNDFITGQEQLIEDLGKELDDHDIDYIVGHPGDRPNFEDVDRLEEKRVAASFEQSRLTQGSDTDSDSWRVYGDTREPYYTNYGSDSDNDLGETW